MSIFTSLIILAGVLVLFGFCIAPCVYGLTQRLIEMALTQKLQLLSQQEDVEAPDDAYTPLLPNLYESRDSFYNSFQQDPELDYDDAVTATIIPEDPWDMDLHIDEFFTLPE